MKFQKGNKLWQNVDPENIGRPRDFNSPLELWKACEEYFLWCDENPIILEEITTYDKDSEQGTQKKESIKPRAYTWKGLYAHLKVKDLDKYRKERVEFLGITTQLEYIIYEQKFTGAASGVFKENIIARNLGLKDSSDVTSGGDKIEPSFVVSSQESGEQLKEFLKELKEK